MIFNTSKRGVVIQKYLKKITYLFAISKNLVKFPLTSSGDAIIFHEVRHDFSLQEKC